MLSPSLWMGYLRPELSLDGVPAIPAVSAFGPRTKPLKASRIKLMNAGIVINAIVADICEVREELVLNDATDHDWVPPNR